MSRKSKRTPEEMKAQRKKMADTAADAETFRKNAFDGRRYRRFSVDDLLELRSVIEAAIEKRKGGAVEELRAQKAAIE